MKKGTLITIMLSFLIVFLLGFFLIFIYQKENEITFYATIKEANNGSYLVEPFENEEIAKSYDIISVSLEGTLDVGDVVIITASNKVMETYPPRMTVESYKIASKNTTVTTTTTEVAEVSQKNETPILPVNPGVVTRDVSQMTEDELISEMESYITIVNSNANNTDSLKEQAKQYFISIVDFIFYEKEINGYTFNKLTNYGKIKVISVALKLDGVINNKFPGYKLELASKYKNIKNKLVTFYLELASDFCLNNDEVCEVAKNDFQLLKNSLDITWTFVINAATASKKEIQAWYEIFSGK